MAFVEPLDVYFCDFAKDATLNGAAVKVIFDEAYMQQFGMVEDFNPTATLKSSDVPPAPHALLLVIGARTFKIREAQPDGNGMTVLQLSAT
mgnify:CR=1 FL=1